MSFMDTLSKLAQTVSGALSGPIIPAVVAIGKDVVELIDKAKDIVEEDDVEVLENLRAELEPKVMAHADATEASLRGSQ